MIKRTIKIKLNNNSQLPVQHGNWIDIHQPNGFKIEEEKTYKINLGIATTLPKWYRAEVKPRSSAWKNYGILLTNNIGEIEWDYSKTWFANIYKPKVENFEFKSNKIQKGDRVLQMQISLRPDAPFYMKVLDLFVSGFKFKEVDVITTNRGGEGSTGK